MDPDRAPSFAGVQRAADKIAKILPATSLLPLELNGQTVWCKAECLQPIGAFKIRGGWHRLTDLDNDQCQTGVVAFSSGNHAQGVAWAAKRLNIPAVIVMPEDSPKSKLENTKALGAEVVTYDRMTGSREELAQDIASQRNAVVVPSFDDPWIIEGQGSCGLEIRQQMIAATGSPPDLLIACCGGGGLASGSALANPDGRIVVVEPEGWDDMAQSLRSGGIVPVAPDPPPTACDALQTMKVSPLTFAILNDRDAIGLAVSESEVREAMRVAFDRLKLVLEPGGAVALAAVLTGKVELTKNTAITLSGGNVDRERFAAMIEP